MKTKKLHLALAVAAAMFTISAIAGPAPGPWPPGFPTVIKSKAEAESCCLPKEKVALACKDCKTVNEKGGEDKKGILGWFKADSNHDCSGCSGKMTLKRVGGEKGVTIGEYTHVCTKCGDKSAFICATHKKG